MAKTEKLKIRLKVLLHFLLIQILALQVSLFKKRSLYVEQVS